MQSPGFVKSQALLTIRDAASPVAMFHHAIFLVNGFYCKTYLKSSKACLLTFASLASKAFLCCSLVTNSIQDLR